MMGKYLQNLSLLTILVLTGGQTLLAEAVLAQNQPSESLPTITQSQLLDPIQVTDVQVNASEAGIAVILEITAETIPTLATEVVENTLIVEIPNGELILAVEDEFVVTNPGSGIEAVRVSPGVDGGIQVVITGVDAPPVAEARLDAGGLVFDVTAASAVDEAVTESIELVVTAETPEDD